MVTTLNPIKVTVDTLSAGIPANVPMVPDAVSVTLPANFPVQLTADSIEKIQSDVAVFDLAQADLKTLSTQGEASYKALNRTLDSYLQDVTQASQPQFFKLVDALSDEVEKQKLGEVAHAILTAKPSLADRFIGLFNRRHLRNATDKVFETLGNAAKLRTKSLADLVNAKEREMDADLQHLAARMTALSTVKVQLRDSFYAFGEDTARLYGLLAVAEAQLPHLLAASSRDLVAQKDLEDKVQALKSLAIARETMLTRLPAEALVMRAIENAGYSTLREVATDTRQQFAEVRLGLLKVNAAFEVKSVQRAHESTARLAKNLQDLSMELGTEVAVRAEQLPGENRLANAKHLQDFIQTFQSWSAKTAEARKKSDLEMAESVQVLSQVRNDLANCAAPQ